MKVFEQLVFDHLSSIVKLDMYQFAYQPNRSVEDAVSVCLHAILQHLEASATYVRILFIDFSSAVNMIVSSKLLI